MARPEARSRRVKYRLINYLRRLSRRLVRIESKEASRRGDPATEGNRYLSVGLGRGQCPELMMDFKGLLIFAVILSFICDESLGAGFYDEVKRRAAEGDPEAQDVLSYLYRTGKGVPKNLDEARRWEALAARGGVSKSRMSPQRPQRQYRSDSTFTPPLNPRQSMVNAASRQGVRMEPRRPGNATRQVGLRAPPRRPSSRTTLHARNGSSRNSQYRTIERGIQRYDKSKKWSRRLSRGSRFLVSPVTFTFKQTKRAVTKVARKAAFASVVSY